MVLLRECSSVWNGHSCGEDAERTGAMIYNDNNATMMDDNNIDNNK